MKSPMKSPLKNSVGSRSPAFQRYSSLAQAGTPSLTLPFSYRHLAELFRCVDTVVSLLFNRKETITFGKLQPAVQEMSRKYASFIMFVFETVFCECTINVSFCLEHLPWIILHKFLLYFLKHLLWNKRKFTILDYHHIKININLSLSLF